MADIGLQLMIKYGLDGEPDQTKVSEWVAKVDKYTSLGYPDEQAGNIAAKAVFPDYGKCKYASQAENLSTLLDLAKRK